MGWDPVWQERTDFAREVRQKLYKLNETPKVRRILNDLAMMINLTESSIESAKNERGSSDHYIWAAERSRELFHWAELYNNEFEEGKYGKFS